MKILFTSVFASTTRLQGIRTCISLSSSSDRPTGMVFVNWIGIKLVVRRIVRSGRCPEAFVPFGSRQGLVEAGKPDLPVGPEIPLPFEHRLGFPTGRISHAPLRNPVAPQVAMMRLDVDQLRAIHTPTTYRLRSPLIEAFLSPAGITRLSLPRGVSGRHPVTGDRRMFRQTPALRSGAVRLGCSPRRCSAG